MSILNPDKCYTQQLKRLPITMPEAMPSDWLSRFYTLLSEQLNLDDAVKQAVFDYRTHDVRLLTEKERFFNELDRHVGATSSYSYKPQLLESLSTLYLLFSNSKTPDDQRRLIASRIAEDVRECSPGFTNRVNFVITLFNMPQNIDELMAQVRFNLVDKIAGILAAKNPQGIHVHNRVIELARVAGFGVWPLNTGDAYVHSGSYNLSDVDIISRVKAGFANHFQLFALVNALREQLEALLAAHGYQGKLELEQEYKKEAYDKFHECIKYFIPIPMGDLLESDPISGKVTNIHWPNVKRALLQTLRTEDYVRFSEAETALLDKLLLDEAISLDSATLSALIPQGYELVQCLAYFSEWSMEQKAALVGAYLKDKSPHEQKEVLAILHDEAPQLTVQLKKKPSLQAIYFAIAMAEKDIASVRTYVEAGENINEALLLLFSPAHKSNTLYWLYENPLLLQRMTVAGMNTLIPEGKYQGKTVAETLVCTKKGRQLLLENGTLQTRLSETTMASTLSARLAEAEAERSTVATLAGFFKKPSPQAVQLVQWIVYGDLTKSEALLKANPALLESLLTEKVTVTDYSRRKVKQKTAFQAALCAMDDELCAMLAPYMSKEEMARQYQAIFPEGHERYYQEQTPFDFSQIVQAITESTGEDVVEALRLELPNHTALWGHLEKFRVDFTNRSRQETVFNPQHLLKAFALYDNHFDTWNWRQQVLFWRQVLGFTKRFLPANTAMDFAQGLSYRVVLKENPARSFKFRYGNRSIFPLSFDFFSGLGYEYAARDAWPRAFRLWRDEAAGGSLFQNLYRAKTASWEIYAARVDPQPLRLLSNSVM